MNDAKSAPFARIPYVKNPCIPPKISKSHNFGKLREIRLPFFDLNNEKWNPLNSQRITRKSLNSPPPVMNHAKFARFLKNPTNPCSPTVPQLFAANSAKFAHFAKIQSDLREINPFRTNSNKYSTLFFRLS